MKTYKTFIESYYKSGRVKYTGEKPSVSLGNRKGKYKVVQHLPVSKSVKSGDILKKKGNEPLSSKHDDEIGVIDDIEKVIANKQLKRDIKKVFAKLDKREATILIYNLGLDGKGERSFKQIGKILKISGGRVSQIAARALRKLRHESLAKVLRPHHKEEKTTMKTYKTFMEDITLK